MLLFDEPYHVTVVEKKGFTSRHRPCKASTPSYFVRHLIYVFNFLIGQIKPFPLPTKEENYLLIHHGTSFKTGAV